MKEIYTLGFFKDGQDVKYIVRWQQLGLIQVVTEVYDPQSGTRLVGR